MKVSNEVLSVLGDAKVEGSSLLLQGQLDRPTYVAVNKVLEAAGLKFLKPGGKLVAIMSAAVTFRSDRLTNEFRALVEERRANNTAARWRI